MVARCYPAGLAVVEVKGGTVWCDEDDRWWSGRAGRESKRIENPMTQVATARHELHRFLRERGVAAARSRVQHRLQAAEQWQP